MKRDRHYPDQKVFYWKGRTPGRRAIVFGTRRVGFLHASKNGGPVLIGESSWHTVSGVYVNTPWGFGLVQFRRLGA